MYHLSGAHSLYTSYPIMAYFKFFILNLVGEIPTRSPVINSLERNIRPRLFYTTLPIFIMFIITLYILFICVSSTLAMYFHHVLPFDIFLWLPFLPVYVSRFYFFPEHL